MIYSIVTMIIKEGRMDAFLAECKLIRPLVLSEPGCLMYDYTTELEIDSERQEPHHARRITLYEKWESDEALEYHNTMPYMEAFAKKVSDMRESVQIRSGIPAFDFE